MHHITFYKAKTSQKHIQKYIYGMLLYMCASTLATKFYIVDADEAIDDLTQCNNYKYLKVYINQLLNAPG
jgi:hypothetical protein